LIARPEPPVDERHGVGLGIVLVAANHVRALDDDLAALAGRQMPALGVHDADADVRASSDRSWKPRTRRQRIGRHLMSGFGHAVGFEDRRAERRLQIVHHLRRQRRAAGSDEP
jgi:hypothetical protein